MRRGVLLPAVVLLVLTATAQAQKFPNGPIKIVTAFAPGGSSDIGLRIVGQRLTEGGWPSSPSSRTGRVAAAWLRPKWSSRRRQTATRCSSRHFNLRRRQNSAAGPSLRSRKRLHADHLDVEFSSVLVVPSKSPVKTAAELVALAKSKPGGVNYASQGVGSGGICWERCFRMRLAFR